GKTVANPRHYRNAEKQPAKAQQRLSRRKKGSKRREKARKLVAKQHQKARRQRRDPYHKTALFLLRTYNTNSLEDLRVANLVRNHELAKSNSDMGWSQYRTILASKAAYAGKQVVLVDPACTTQNCLACGARVRKSLSMRTHVCPSCGLGVDRDQHAAKHVL